MLSEPENQIEESEKRDIDLEDIVGNLMIAEYQVEKLRSIRFYDELVHEYHVE